MSENFTKEQLALFDQYPEGARIVLYRNYVDNEYDNDCLKEILMAAEEHKSYTPALCNKKFSADMIRVLKALYDFGEDVIKPLRFLDDYDYNYKQLFVLCLASMVDPSSKKENKSFVIKCLKEVDELYGIYIRMIQYQKEYSKKSILKQFDFSYYASKIQYLQEHPGENINLGIEEEDL